MRIIRTTFYLLTLLIALTSCVRPPSEKIHLRYALWGTPEQVDIEKQVIEAFEAQNPDIKLDLEMVGFGRYSSKIQAMMVGDVAPDLFWVEMTQYHEWASRGVMTDMTSLVEEMKREYGEWMPIPDQAFRAGDRYYGIPINCHGILTYYNQKAFQEAGVSMPPEGPSWEWIQKVGPLLSRKAGAAHVSTEYAVMLPQSRAMLFEFGGSLVDDKRHPTRITAHQPNTIEFIRRFRQLVYSPFTVPPEQQQDHGTHQLFRDGKVAIYFSGRYAIPLIKSAAFPWEIAPFPSGTHGRISQHGGTAIALNRSSRHPEAARRFLKYYGSPQGLDLAVRGGRYVPIYRKEAYAPEFLALTPPSNVRYFSETMEAGASTAILYAPGVSEFALIYDSLIERAIASPSVPEEELASTLQQELERWLGRMKKRGDL